MYLILAAICLVSWTYEKFVVHMDAAHSNAMLAAALLASAMHIVKTAKAAVSD